MYLIGFFHSAAVLLFIVKVSADISQSPVFSDDSDNFTVYFEANNNFLLFANNIIQSNYKDMQLKGRENYGKFVNSVTR